MRSKNGCQGVYCASPAAEFCAYTGPAAASLAFSATLRGGRNGEVRCPGGQYGERCSGQGRLV